MVADQTSTQKWLSVSSGISRWSAAVASGSSASFQACVCYFRYAPDCRHIAVPQRTTFRAKLAVSGRGKRTSIRPKSSPGAFVTAPMI